MWGKLATGISIGTGISLGKCNLPHLDWKSQTPNESVTGIWAKSIFSNGI